MKTLWLLLVSLVLGIGPLAGSLAAEVKVTAGDAQSGDRFGVPVAVSRNVAIDGAYHADDTGSDSGSVYIYEPSPFSRDEQIRDALRAIAKIIIDEASSSNTSQNVVGGITDKLGIIKFLNEFEDPQQAVYCLDVSASMQAAGLKKLELAIQSIKNSLLMLHKDDHFNIITFWAHATVMSPSMLPATVENIKKALKYLDQFTPGRIWNNVGTNPLEAIEKALALNSSIIVLVTDGLPAASHNNQNYIETNPQKILETVREKNVNRASIFVVGFELDLQRSPGAHLLVSLVDQHNGKLKIVDSDKLKQYAQPNLKTSTLSAGTAAVPVTGPNSQSEKLVNGSTDIPHISPPTTDAAAGARKIYWTDVRGIHRADIDGGNVETLLPVTLSLPQSIAVDTGRGKVYWTDKKLSKIQRANLDGTGVEYLVTESIIPFGIAIDASAGKIYWTDLNTRKIQRANLDGTGIEDLTTKLRSPRGIAMDTDGGKIYWADVGKIRRANLDGTLVEDLVTTESSALWDIALDADGGKIYWTDFNADKIQRANLDGTNVEDLVIEGHNPEGIAVDAADGKLYWAEGSSGKIRRANLDGTNVEGLSTARLIRPLDITVDSVGRKLYWTDADAGKIQRANLNGTGVEDLVTAALVAPGDIALDTDGGKIYWADFRARKVQRANLDGTNVEDLVTTSRFHRMAIAVDVDGGKIYWMTRGRDRIQRANLDGTSVETLVKRPELKSPIDIALDTDGGNIYWTESQKIRRADLDGTIIEDLVTQGLTQPRNIAIDVSGGKIYWTDVGDLNRGIPSKIQRANLDGTNIEDLVVTGWGQFRPTAIALDGVGGKLYWMDTRFDAPSKIQRANLDGTGVETLVTELVYPQYIALDLTRPSHVALGKTGASSDSQSKVTIPDLNLRTVLAEALGKKPGVAIFDTDLVTLTRLEAAKQNISDLTGLEYCSNLMWLNLKDNQLRDLNPLAKLTNLTSLHLGRNHISDLSPLANLTNLTSLNLGRNPVSDISPLTNLTNLVSLGLYTYSNQLRDLSPLANLTNLTTLYLHNNNISDLSPLTNLTNLTMLHLGNNQISDISPLSTLTNLRQLYLGNNQISNISPLANLTSPGVDFVDIDLSLHDNQISNLKPLVDNPGLVAGDSVDIRRNPLSPISRKTHIPDLQARGVNVQFDASLPR